MTEGIIMAPSVRRYHSHDSPDVRITRLSFTWASLEGCLRAGLMSWHVVYVLAIEMY